MINKPELGSFSIIEPLEFVGLYMGGVLLFEKKNGEDVFRFKAANGDAVEVTEDQLHDMLYKLACDAKSGST